MSHPSKKVIQDRAISGLTIQGSDVASVTKLKGGASITLRHVWPDSTDARVWDGVRRAYVRLARDLANAYGKPVDVYSKHGDQIDQISPDL
jgi:hypothetical protein